MPNQIHPNSVVDKEVELGNNVTIGPYCVVRGRVRIGDGTVLHSHLSVGSDHGIVEIGRNNRFAMGSSVGAPPQDISYKGEPTKLLIGDNNDIREMCTINIGTSKGGGATRIGNDCLIMAYCHFGHDTQIGNDVQLANLAQMGGHVTIEDHAKVGAMCGFNQFVRVGKYAFIGGCSTVNKDILPFTLSQGNHAVMRACNRIGMERSGFSKKDIEAVNRAIRILTQGAGTVEENLARIEKECEMCEPVRWVIEGARISKRGLAL